MTLLLATDIRVASEHASFDLSEVKRGILPGNGGTHRTVRQLPYPIAMEMLLLARRLSAERAAHFGLVNEVVPHVSWTWRWNAPVSSRRWLRSPFAPSRR